jgi:fibronectin type 3 domain-containing protein
VNSASVSGSGFSVSGATLPATLSPGQSLTLNVRFDPGATGSYTGQLTVSSNSPPNPTLTVSLSGTGGPREVDLTWSAPSASSDPITGYKVYRAPGGTSSFAVVDSMDTQTAYTDSGVQSGQSYSYYVTSVDSSGVESSPSNTTTVTVP